jgi:virginiamycin B lyase
MFIRLYSILKRRYGVKGKRRTGLIVGVICLPVAIVVLLMGLGNAATARLEDLAPTEQLVGQQPLAVRPGGAALGSDSRDGFVFRFDPALESFETFTLPTAGADPHSVTVRSSPTNLDVWFTEPGADRIGRLVYTATQDYAFHEYTLPTGSEPLNLVQDGTFVWFTARQGNYIGRLEIASGQVVTFSGLTGASQPSGIDVAPDGSVWFTEMAADQIGRLVVTTTSDYDVTEYPIPATGVGAYGVEVQSNGYVWFGETSTGRVRRLKVADGTVNIYFGLGQGSYPFKILYDAGRDYLWVTEFEANRISQLEVTTNHIVNQIPLPPSGGSPRGLTRVGNNEFWFSQYRSGQIGRLVYTSSISFQLDSFSLPVNGLYAADITVSDDDALWVVAHSPYQVHLPLVTRNYYDGPTPLFGVQMYGTVNHTTGLSQVVAAGVRWIRVPISWESVEPANVTPDQYSWDATDRQVAAITDAGMEPLLTLGGNPEWAATYPMGPVTDVADLQEFMGALVERYDGDGINDAPGSPVVRYWEIYNEPDSTNEDAAAGGGYALFGYNGAGYAELLDAIYPVVKAASPQAQVVFGGVAHDNFDYEGGGFDPDFVDDVLSHCTGPCFDVMNFHYFPFYRFRWETYGKDVIGKANYFRSKLASYGFGRPLMCTETTWPSASSWGSAALQSRYVIAAYVRGMAAGLMVQNWYAWKDTDSSLPGLLDGLLQPKPAYHVYQTLTEQLDPAIFERALTTAETGHRDIEGYVFSVLGSGGWERRDALWLDCPSLQLAPPQGCPGASQVMSITANTVRVTDKYGASAVVEDSHDGLRDGRVTLTITPSPVFIDYTP